MDFKLFTYIFHVSFFKKKYVIVITHTHFSEENTIDFNN